MKRIVLFASGSGSNVENIVRYFHNEPNVTIAAVLTNKRDAKVLERCNNLKINGLYFNRNAFYTTDCVLDILKTFNPDLIVLAGFLWKMPEKIVRSFPGKIINIHPALLPKYGGKGMYGNHVHQAVKDSGDIETGITIHYVNENYDEGAIIAQEKVAIKSNDSTEKIAEKVHALEYEHFPKTIAKLLGLSMASPETQK
ncbi:phosphoribosylglycinamide formyltransferase [Maribacter halichondriae]|uniref:phosphoribosylglycinamide formyltransferase n=1 Tax=Maribacter halichondriae TaxID=2980554 RepID=UPI0023587DBB|nr:phosphoribosylglycinamide formyltransferase [Maribacter sp. Hal144]